MTTKVSDLQVAGLRPLRGAGWYWDGTQFLPRGLQCNENGALKVEQDSYEYVQCGTNSTTQLGSAGAAGDFLHTLSVRWNDQGSSPSVSIKDNGTTVFSIAGSPNTNGPSAMTQNYVLNCVSKNGPWSISATSGAEAFATGRFTD